MERIEECKILIGGMFKADGGLTYFFAIPHKVTQTGEAASVNFDYNDVYNLIDNGSEIVGFHHTHPGFSCTPSNDDDKTMVGWCKSLGRPLVSVISNDNDMIATLYDADGVICDTESLGVDNFGFITGFFTINLRKFVLNKHGEMDEIYRKSSEKYGEVMQLTIAIEEMSELTKALTKKLRGQHNLSSITEEMADVENMLGQLKWHFKNKSGVNAVKAAKLNRLLERMDDSHTQQR